MKNKSLMSRGFLLIVGAWFTPSHAAAPVVGQAVKVGESAPLSSIALQAPTALGGNLVVEIPLLLPPLGAAPDSALAPVDVDPVVQWTWPEPRIPAPNTTFEGISNADNEAVLGLLVLPPDPNMDVGPNHIVQSVNLLLKVFDKAGTSLLGPIAINSLFASLGPGSSCANTNDGDPIVLYDPLADRWLVSQFALPTFPNGPFSECIAISQTADPTGSYFLYEFVYPNNLLGDYPKFGVWPDGYYMSANQFSSGTLGFAGVGVLAFDRAKMLAGDPTAGFIYFDLAASEPNAFSLLPSDLDGPPPPAGQPNTFIDITADEFGDPQGDAVRLFDFHADFANPANSTFTERPESPIATAAFDGNLCNFDLFGGCIPQPGTAQGLEALSAFAMHRLQYRNFGTHEALVTNHTVDAGIDQAGVRFYELRRHLPGGSFFIINQATFAPDDDHRWSGSAALDGQGNLAVGYSVSSENTFPSIRYAGRLKTDPPGLPQGEAVLQTGAGSQTSPFARWGDYSMMAVDPSDDCTFWYTTEYYAATSDRGWQTRIGSFTFPQCLSPVVLQCRGVNATIVGTEGNDTLIGTNGPDVIVALGGNDTVKGRGGNDRICLGRGNDRGSGGAGRDRIFGEAGRDRLRGGSGRDRCVGGSGRDTASSCERVSGVP